MILRSASIVLLLFPILTFGQYVSDSLYISFYNKTLAYFFSDSNFVDAQVGFKRILVQTDFQKRYLIKRVGDYRFKFYYSEVGKVLEKPLASNIGRHVYNLRHEYMRDDTVDIFLDEWVISAIDKKSITMPDWYKGRRNGEPITRFIYNRKTTRWEFVSYSRTVEAKRKNE